MTEFENEATVVNEDEVQIIELTRQPIDLYKILKFEGLVGSGGEAKAAIAEGYVTVNDEVETLKRKKIVSGDTISFNGVFYRMHCDQELEANEKRSVASAESNAAKVGRPKKATPATKKAGRKAIGIKS